MDTQKLEYFILAAEQKSFSKAARRSYISTNAVIKHIDALEQEVGVILFSRTHGGIRLTPAGQVFYDYAKSLISLEKEAVNRAQKINYENNTLIRIGSSSIRPHNVIFDLWASVAALHPNLRLHIERFRDQVSGSYGSHEFFDQLGKDYDIVACVFSSNLWKGRCQALEINRLPVRIGVPVTHPLAIQRRLTLQDLSGQTLITAPYGNTEQMDQLIDHLNAEVPNIHILYRLINSHTFNECVDNNYLTISLDPWKSIHPAITVKEIDWDYTLPFGIIYANDPTPAVEEFIQIMKQVIREQKR